MNPDHKTHSVQVFLPAYELTAGHVFDFFYMDKGIRYDLAAVFTNAGDLAFVATTILGMYAGTPPGCSELLQSFLESHPSFHPAHARFPVTWTDPNKQRLLGKSYIINTAFQERLVLFTESACTYAAQHFSEGMMDWQCCIDHGHAQCRTSAEELVNVRRAHALGAISGIYQVIRDAFKPVAPPVTFPYDPAARITAIVRFKPDNANLNGAERELTAYDFDYGCSTHQNYMIDHAEEKMIKQSTDATPKRGRAMMNKHPDISKFRRLSLRAKDKLISKSIK